MPWILLPLLVILAAGCSSSGETVTLEEWAVVVCDSRNALQDLPTPASLTDLDLFQGVADTLDEAVTNLDEVSPPAIARDYQRGLVELYRNISSAQRDFIEAATDADAATLDAALIEYQAQLQEAFNEIDPDLPTIEIEAALNEAGCNS